MGRDKSYRWLWVAALVAGIDAAKKRYEMGKHFTLAKMNRNR